MSNISRGVYQKCAEENKRLMRDIEILVMKEGNVKHECYVKWRKHFIESKNFRNTLKCVAKYINKAS
jgi:hypothetical protein